MQLRIASAVIGFSRDKTPFLQFVFSADISGPQAQYEILERLAMAENDGGSGRFQSEGNTLQVYPNGAGLLSIHAFYHNALHIMKHLNDGESSVQESPLPEGIAQTLRGLRLLPSLDEVIRAIELNISDDTIHFDERFRPSLQPD
jgi:hypothetical protein